MASDTDTGKISRWYRGGVLHRNEINQLLDLYWGGPERRITGLTVRILGVNAIAIVIFLLGLLYLGQYQTKLIHSKLEVFETEIFLITAAVTEGGVVSAQAEGVAGQLSVEKVGHLIGRFSATLGRRVLVFDSQGILIVDSDDLSDVPMQQPFLRGKREESKNFGIEAMKSLAGLVLSLLPSGKQFPLYQGIHSSFAKDYPDVEKAMRNNLSISAWRDEVDQIVLTAAMPLVQNSRVIGAVLLVNDAQDIRDALSDAWFDILRIFLVTSLITILLSVYLSGVIAKPLRKLASAAEGVRKGKLGYNDIPDMRDRNDEIGELSLVLREMTAALWERMDAIESFAADVAHELKNPLTSLKSAVETASIVKDMQDQDKLLKIIRHDVERLERLITDISSVSRLDTELSRDSFSPVDLKALLWTLFENYKDPLQRDQAASHADHENCVVLKDNVSIRYSSSRDEEFLVLGNEGRLCQVFQNILTNSLSFSPVGETISVYLRRDEDKVCVVFENHGPAIPESRLEMIFDRFYTERPEHEDYGRHSGLGLSICKQIVEAHKGHIYAENMFDSAGNSRGVRFVVELGAVRIPE